MITRHESRVTNYFFLPFLLLLSLGSAAGVVSLSSFLLEPLPLLVLSELPVSVEVSVPPVVVSVVDVLPV